MFFRKEIRITRDGDECNKIRALLAQHGIKTYVPPQMVNRGSTCHGVPFIDQDSRYEYHIRVDRKDEEKALEILRRFW